MGNSLIISVKNSFEYYSFHDTIRNILPYKLFGDIYMVIETKRKFRKVFHRNIDLDNPSTLNEKLQWLKLNVRDDLQTIVADKYAARDFWKQYGEDGLIPLIYSTDNWKNISLDVIPDVPCIVKSNTGCANFEIIRDKHDVDIDKLRQECRKWMFGNPYFRTQEWQYKNIKPRIIIEKLLLDKNGHIPNDYKFNYINGKLQFIYCSIDRERKNYRSIYDVNWKRMNMEWVAEKNLQKRMVGKDIPMPLNFKRMNEIGEDIARRFAYVRVDFYEVDGHMYYGEITLHHGAGYDTFYPEKYDKFFGDKLVLPLR